MRVEWLLPAALAGLALVAVPILVHLFAHTPPTRVVVPSLRLVARLAPRLRRRRFLRDPWLLALRIGAVALAALAAASPLFVTALREQGWATRTARALVVVPGPAGAGALTAAVTDERREAFASEVFEVDEAADGVPRALAWLDRQAPSRRDVVVVGEGRGRLDPAAFGAVPDGVGVRLRAVAAPRPSPDERLWIGSDGSTGVRAARVSLRSREARSATGEPASSAAVDVEPVTMPAIPVTLVAPPASQAMVDAVWAGVLADGVFLRDAARWRPMRVEWVGNAGAAAGAAEPLSADDRRHILPLLRGQGADVEVANVAGTLVMRIATAPTPPAVERMARAALAVAAGDNDAWEAPAWDARVRTAIERPTAASALGSTENVEARDGRWLWAAAIGCLLAEQWLRRRRDRVARDARAGAADRADGAARANRADGADGAGGRP